MAPSQVQPEGSPTAADLRHRNEMLEVEAKRAWYATAHVKDKNKLWFWKMFIKFGLPVLALGFIVCYFMLGMSQYYAE